MRPRFFQTSEELRSWFDTRGASESELWIGYYRKGTGRTGLAYDDAVDEALCHGWIDGQVRKVDELSYANRFTPRRPRSIWSLTNVQRVRRLIRDGRMRPSGLAAFRARTRERTGVHSFERPTGPEVVLDRSARERLASAPAALDFFEAQPPGYRRLMVRWVMGARRPATRARRLDAVISAALRGRRVDPLHPYEPSPARPTATVGEPGRRETS